VFKLKLKSEPWLTSKTVAIALLILWYFSMLNLWSIFGLMSWYLLERKQFRKQGLIFCAVFLLMGGFSLVYKFGQELALRDNALDRQVQQK
jgi:hypothetical protein